MDVLHRRCLTLAKRRAATLPVGEMHAAVESLGIDPKAQMDLRRRQRDQLAKNVERRVAEIVTQYGRLESDLRARTD